jgi:PAS domain S-box-containing protein
MIAYYGVPIKLPSGKPFGTICVLDREETEFLAETRELMQKMASLIEGRIREEQQNRQLQKFFDTTLELFCIADTNGYFIKVNKAWSLALGYSKTEIEGKKYLDFVHPEDLFDTLKAIKKLENQHQVINFTNRYRARDGSYKFIEWRAFPSGKLIHAAARDVTERINSEKILLEEKHQYQTVFNESQNTIAILDAENGQIVDANPQALEQAGVSSLAELQNCKTFFSLFPHPDYSADKALKILENIAKGKEEVPVPFEWSYKNLKGESRWDLVRLTPVTINGEKRIMVTGIDITTRKQAEEKYNAIREKAEISSRLATLGEMVAGISHEINNPLTSIIGFSSLLEDEDLPDSIKEQVKHISQSSRRIKDIVEKILTFARQTGNRKSLASIHDLIDNCLDLRSYTLGTANIEIIKEYGNSVPKLAVDAGQMQQVFLNILINAEHAIKNAGRKGGFIRIGTRTESKKLYVSFEDNGTGMSEETRAKIFQPFYTTKEPGEGTGLGMALTRSIVLEHDGSIEAKSIPGKGSTIIISLPLKTLQEEDRGISDVADGMTEIIPEKRLSVLVVDDEPLITFFAKKNA